MNNDEIATRIGEVFARLRETAEGGEREPVPPMPPGSPTGWHVPDDSWMWRVGQWEVPPLCGILDLDAFDEHGNWREGKRPADWPEDA